MFLAEQRKESVLYRVEESGILVYDSEARYTTDNYESLKLQPGQRSTRNLESCKPFGNYYSDKAQYGSMKAYPAYKPICTSYTLVTPPSSLRFDSKFESGNLKKAIQVGQFEYNLYLDYDTETQGHVQWFYFAVSNIEKARVRFNILNMMKPVSLFNRGMKPLCKSAKEGIWKRKGSCISYFPNGRRREHHDSSVPSNYFTLTFTLDLEHQNDTTLIAHCHPYTFSDLKNYISEISKNQECLQVNSLCESLAGNPCYIFTITKNADKVLPFEIESQLAAKSANTRRLLKLKNRQKSSNKKLVFITGRVHPGESNSSYIIEGLTNFLMSEQARKLRSRFIFKVVPMMNPDGVVYGNSRCSLLGVDLNRRWKHPHHLLHPTVYYTKQYFKYLCEEYDAFLYIDVHGHSCKSNVFMYGCRTSPGDFLHPSSNYLIKMFPFLLAQSTPGFQYADCRFANEQAKEETARIVVFKELGLLNSYTLEASLNGTDETQFDEFEMRRIGSHVLQVLWVYLNKQAFTNRLKIVKNPSEIIEKTPLSVTQAADTIKDEQLEELNSNDGSADSDSCPSDNDDKKLKFIDMFRRKKNPKKSQIQHVCYCQKHKEIRFRANKLLKTSKSSSRYSYKTSQELTPENESKALQRSKRSPFTSRIKRVDQSIPSLRRFE